MEVVLHLAGLEYRLELDPAIRLNMEAKRALEHLFKLKIVRLKNVQLMVKSRHGIHMELAHNLVVLGPRIEPECAFHQDMAESHALISHFIRAENVC
jgi:hypothetical protein